MMKIQYYWIISCVILLNMSSELDGRYDASDYRGKNFKLGPILFDLTGFINFEYTDNLTGSSVNALDDFIISPGINLGAEWKISDINTLTLDTGASYQKYMNNSELDSQNNFVQISPDSNLKFTILISDIILELYDSLSYSIDPTDAFAVDSSGSVDISVTRYGRFDNTIGVDATWDLNDVDLRLGLSRRDVLPQGSQFDFTKKHTHKVSGGIDLDMSPKLKYGLTGFVSETVYAVNFNSDNNTYGAFFDVFWQPMSLLRINASIGYTIIDSKGNGTNGGSSSTSSGIDGVIGLDHVWTQRYSHGITYSRGINEGDISNSVKSSAVTYYGSWIAMPRMIISGALTYSDSSSSRSTASETFDYWIFSLGGSYAINTRTTVSLGYGYTTKSSSIAERSFDRNTITAGIDYDF